ncbi:hypothetical protein [Sphingobacterium paucimobilis]|uniref:hypothetical protein n=1 Tax=Sphingobacterium paucimobilis TaxID=1385985 RepID=UPI001183529F|nr:hypothetical protein [Sphingobacterium paucimobilis]
MKTIISIKIVKPEWLTMTKEDKDYFASINEADDLENMKYGEGWKFTFDYPITEVSIKRNASFSLQLKSKIDEQIKTVTLDDMLLLEFIGDDEKQQLAISNSLLESDFSTKNKKGTQYYYFHLDGRIPYQKFGELIYITEKV